MYKKINIKYNSEDKTVSIESDGLYFFADCLSGVDISEWGYPFLMNNTRWNGLYNELKGFYENESFSVIFYGSDDELSIIKKAFEDKPVDVIGLNNKVVIIYDNKQLTTKMTINGKIFDTSKLMNRSIDEWVFPFSFRDTEWKGLFAEIEQFLDIGSYSIQFMGQADDMQIIMDNCPENINVTYKAPAVPKKKTSPVVSQNINNTAEQKPTLSTPPKQISKPNLNNIKGNAKGLLNEAKAEYSEMKSNNHGMLLFGQIAVIAAAICCILFTILMSRFLMILSIIPAIVFSVLSFVKGYKKLAVCSFAAVLIVAVISWIIITIRWNIALKELEDSLSDFNDSLDDYNDFLNDTNDALNDIYGN